MIGCVCVLQALCYHSTVLITTVVICLCLTLSLLIYILMQYYFFMCSVWINNPPREPILPSSAAQTVDGSYVTALGSTHSAIPLPGSYLRAQKLQHSKTAEMPFVLPYVCTNLQFGLFPGRFSKQNSCFINVKTHHARTGSLFILYSSNRKMRLCWVLLLGVLIVSGTVRSRKTSKSDDDNNDDKQDKNGDESGDGDDGRYLVLQVSCK